MDKGLMRQAEQIWGALDELAISDPTTYKTFIQHQLKGASIPSSAAIPDPRQPAVEKLRTIAAPRGTTPATILTRPRGEDEEGISDGEDGSRLALKLTASPACKRRNHGKLLIEELPTSPPERPEPTPIDCTEAGLAKERLQEPKHTVRLEESEDCAPRYIVTVSLPDVTTINDCNLGISFDDLLLEVPGKCRLHVAFSRPIVDVAGSAKFSARTRTLTVSLPVATTTTT
ncbi:PIH1 domain-containing protein 2 [Petromyzon marinus]|nr:PIH1 domain-containing protein 2 isoform X2 [Petromyzon marinus]XP_032820481.1 PIH1 domain-containing protein 2 isoform X2 [Petromyzon marinus]XP_032820482.1 PIH1 domain-containing protein 2 isoform X2 [Petromyzon marinus]